MSGNTRGKLKEHFEGVHRNMDWALHHIQQSLTLIHGQLSFTPDMLAVKGDDEATLKVLEANPVYLGVKALGEGITQIDSLAQQIYATL